MAKKKKTYEELLEEIRLSRNLDVEKELAQADKIIETYRPVEAPIRSDLATEEKKRTWFSKGLFEDGYDFGDITKTILGTNKDIADDLSAGLAGIGEGVIDTGAYLVGSSAKILGADDFAKKVQKFQKRNLVEEYGVADKLTRNSLPGGKALSLANDVVNKSESEKVSVLGDRADSLAQSVGNLAGVVGLQGAGIPWWLTSWTSTFGEGTEEAFQSGATYGEAGAYGVVKATSEVLFEKLSGGIKFGGVTLDEGLKKILSEKISNKLVRSLTSFGLDMAGEGMEEVLTEISSNIGKKLTYADDKTWNELLTSEEAMDSYLEAFIGGAALGGGVNVKRAYNSVKTGRDYDTGLTADEQAVVDAEVGNRVTEKQKTLAEQQKKNKLDEEIKKVIEEKTAKYTTLTDEQIDNFTEEVKANFDSGDINFSTIELSKKERREIEDRVIEELKRGELDTFTIENTLFKDSALRMRALNNELKTAADTRKTEIEAELEQISRNFNNRLSGNEYLKESYRQKALKNELLDYKLSENASEKAKKLVESAVKAGANNTRQTHERIDLAIKVADDSSMDIEFANDTEFEQMGYYKDVKDLIKQYREATDETERAEIQKKIDIARKNRKSFVNGVALKGQNKVILNVNSNRAMETILGHEITHFAENSKSYSNLSKFLKEYAESKGDYKGRYKSASELYKNDDGSIDEELLNQEITADLVGEYIFTDQDFITRLSVKEPNIFRKAYDFVKNAYKMAVAGSAEGRKLEQAKRMFEKAYREMRKETADKAETDLTADGDGDSKHLRYSLEDYGFEEFNKESMNNLKQRRIITIDSREDLLQHIDRAKKNKDEKQTLALGAISDSIKTKIEKDLDKKLFEKRQYSFIITYDGIQHISKHFDTNDEIADEIIRLLALVSNYDTIAFTQNRDQKRLKFEKKYTHAEVRSIEVVSKKKSALELVTVFYTKKNKKGSRVSSRAASNYNSSPSGVSSSNNSISNNGQKSNTRLSLSDTHINKVTDNGLTMTYVRVPNQNTQNYGSTYGQNIEPAGEYMSMDTSQGKHKIAGYEYGTILFKKPLVLEHINTGDTGWKKTVSDMYNGLTGKKLTDALIEDGYDAIVTYDKYGYNEIVNLNGTKLGSDPDIRYSLTENADITYESLISKPDMKVTQIGYDSVRQMSRRDIVNAARRAVRTEGFKDNLGRLTLTNSDTKSDIIIGSPAIRHGLNRNYEANAKIALHLGDYLKNAVKVNEIMPRGKNSTGGYILLGYGRTNSGEGYPAYFVVQTLTTGQAELLEFDSLYSFNGKKISEAVSGADQGVQSLTSDTISISDLLDLVNEMYSDILPKSVTEQYGIERKKSKLGEKVKYSLHNPNEDIVHTNRPSMRDLFSATEEDIAPIREDIAGTKKTANEDKTLTDDDLPIREDIPSPEGAQAEVNPETEEARDTSINKIEVEKKKILDKLEIDKKNAREDLKKRQEQALADLGDKETYISSKALELYNELVNLKKGTRASYELGYLLDYGYKWSELKTALLNTRAKPNKIVNKASGIEAIVRETIERDYESKRDDIGYLDAEKYIKGLEEEANRAIENIVEAEDETPLITKTRKELRQALLETNRDEIIDALENAKDINSALMYNTDTIRVSELVFGRKAGKKINELIFQKALDNESKSIAWQNKQRKDIKALGIKAKDKFGRVTKESAAVQKWGEGEYVTEFGDVVKYTDSDLMMEFPNIETQKKIKNAAKEIRAKYDLYIDLANDVLTGLGFKPIQKREDYFMHFQELGDFFSRNGIPFNPQSMQENDLPTDINGLTEFFVPQKKFFANMFHREGKRTVYDAITGIDKYISSVADLIYHTEDIQRGRAFEELIRENYGQGDVATQNRLNLPEEEQLKRREKQQNHHLTKYVSWLHQWTNNLAGKKNRVDRAIEDIFQRTGFSVLDTARKQVGANMIGFNISSALTNLIAPVQAMAKTNKAAVARGTADTIRNIIQKDDFVDKNSFLTSRFGADMLSKNAWQKIQDAAYVFMKGLDWFSSNQIVRSKYYELTSKGMSEEQAHAEAGKFAARIMGDRTKGANAMLFNSKLLNVVSQFQLEVNNQIYSMFYDTYQESKEKAGNDSLKTAAGITFTLGQLFAFTHLFGKTFEAIAGYNPTFDVVGIIMTALGLGDDEDKTSTERLQEAAGELLKALPYSSLITDGGRIPLSSGLPDIAGLITGGKDDYGNEINWKDEAAKIPYLALPAGYGQIKKTIQGLGMFDDDLPVSGSYTDSGNLRFEVEDTPLNRAQAGLFGQWASSNARDYFDNERKPLKEKQIQEFKDLDLPMADYWKYREGLNKHDTLEEKFDYIANLDLPIDKKNIMINNIVDRKEKVDLINYDDFESYEEFDWYTRNPEKYDFLESIGVSYKDYKASDESKEAYDWVYKNPEKYTLSKAIGDVVTYRQYTKEIGDLAADKDSNGKAISGSKKAKVANYINNLDTDYYSKIILFKSTYPADDTYNYEIIDYLNNRQDISYEEMATILTELGFMIGTNGNIYW